MFTINGLLSGIATGVDVIADAVMGTEVKTETAEALNTLAKAAMADPDQDKVDQESDKFDYQDYEYDEPAAVR